MDITQAIEKLVPKAKYDGYPRDREHYNNLRRNDARPKPSWKEIEPLLKQDAPSLERPLTAEKLKKMLEDAADAGKPATSGESPGQPAKPSRDGTVAARAPRSPRAR